MNFSELELEWHPTKNGTLTFDQVNEKSSMKVWWVCAEGHEWSASVVNRLKGKGCPVCAGRSLVIELLSTSAPNLLSEFHSTKDSKISASLVHAKSSIKVWWACSAGHKWEASLNSRISKLEGCPNCGVSVGLMRTHPDLVAEWHPTKNGNLQAHQVTSYSSTKIWWLGVCGHEWEASVANRVSGKGCPVCLGHTLMIEFLSTSAPKLLPEYHLTKNGKITARQTHAKSSAKVWWVCSKGHEWEASIVSRIEGNDCGVCSSFETIKAVLEETAPDLVAECHPDKNSETKPNRIATLALWWLCPVGHEWRATIIGRAGGKTCPFCRGKKILTGSTDIFSAKPNLADEWHPTKNGSVTVHEVSIYSNDKYWWSCVEGHEWRTNPSALVSIEGDSGCPLCCNRTLLAAEWHPTRNTDVTFEQLTPQLANIIWWVCSKGHEWKSSFGTRFVSGTVLSGCALCSHLDTLISEWHPTKNGTSTVEEIITHPRKPMRWLSQSCGHEWESSAHDRTKRGSLYGCPFCSNSKKLIKGETDFLTTHPNLAAEWHPTKNGTLKPDQITSGVNYKYWWLGSDCGHEWEAFLSNRLKGYRCAVCSVYSPFLEKKFVSLTPELIAQWHPTKNGNLTADQVHKHSHAKVWWLGDCGHEWFRSPRSSIADSKCPACSSHVPS